MKIKVNDVQLFELTEIQKNVIKNDIPAEIFDADMKRRLQYILTHKYEQCFKRLKAEWDPKLEALGVGSIPTNKDAYAALVFARAEYKDRSAKDLATKQV